MMLTFKSLQEFIDQRAKLHGRPPVRFVLHDGLLERGTFFQPHAFVDDGRKDEVSIGFPEHVLQLCREFRRSPLDEVEHDSDDAQLLVVYLYHAGNSVGRKSGTIPPFHDRMRGALPWYRTWFSTSSCCSDSCCYAPCGIMGGQALAPEGIRGHPSLCRRRASAPVTRNPFLASPASLPVPPVSRQHRHQRPRHLRRHHRSPPAGDARAKWRPHSLAAPIRPVRSRA